MRICSPNWRSHRWHRPNWLLPREDEGACLAHATELQHFCGRYGIGYVRADAERPFEEIVLQAFRQGRFLE